MEDGPNHSDKIMSLTKIQDLTISTRHCSKWSKRTIDYVVKHLTLQPDELVLPGGIKDDCCYSMMQMALVEPKRYDYDLSIVRKDRKTIAAAITFINSWEQLEIMIYVRPEHRRRGVGKTLLRHVTAAGLAKGLTKMHISPWNRVAKKFYTGFYSEFLPAVKASLAA